GGNMNHPHSYSNFQTNTQSIYSSNSNYSSYSAPNSFNQNTRPMQVLLQPSINPVINFLIRKDNIPKTIEIIPRKKIGIFPNKMDDPFHLLPPLPRCLHLLLLTINNLLVLKREEVNKRLVSFSILQKVVS